MAAFLEQNSIAPAVCGLEGMAFGGSELLAVVQCEVNQGLLFVAGVDVDYFFVGQAGVGGKVGCAACGFGVLNAL